MRYKLLTLTAVMFGISGAHLASAADMEIKAPAALPVPASAYNWGGLYVGGNIGYGWGAASDPGLSFVDGAPLVGFAGYFAAGGNVTPNLTPSGLLGGGQIGFNWTLNPNWVAGLVADFQGSGIKDSATNTITPLGLPTSLQSNSEQIDWFGTLRAKLGFALNNWLLYGTGGLAYGRVATAGCICFGTPVVGLPPLNFAGSNSATNVGWAAGAGLNYGLTSNWIVGIEYLYVNLGNVSYVETTTSAPASSVTINNRAAVQIARVLLDYKF